MVGGFWGSVTRGSPQDGAASGRLWDAVRFLFDFFCPFLAETTVMGHFGAVADRVTQSVRSKIMASVGTQNTGPELLLRKRLHRLGYRYATNSVTLPGKPDLVFRSLGKVVFVHGCFWHGHTCRWGRLPKSRPEYWRPKITANRTRDSRVARKVRRMGWSVMIVWQCQLRDLELTVQRVARFLERRNRNLPICAP